MKVKFVSSLHILMYSYLCVCVCVGVWFSYSYMEINMAFTRERENIRTIQNKYKSAF